MKNSGIEWIGEIPDSWELIKIGSIFACRNEKVSDKEFAPLSVSKSGIVPQMENVAKSDAGDNRKLVLKNDFVINSRSDRKQSCGVSFLDGSVSLINTVLYPIADNIICSEYENIVMKNYGFAEEFYRWGHGIVADLWTTRWQEMKSIVLPLPPVKIQVKIVNDLSNNLAEVDKLVEIQQAQIEKLKEYKQSVITEAVTKGIDPNVPMKDSGVEWIGKIPEQWKIVPLKSFFSFGKGLPITKENLKEDGVAVISYGQIHAKWNSGVTVHEELKRFVSEDFLCSNPQSLVKLGDFIFADTSEDREGCGNCVYIDTNEKIFAGYHTIIISGEQSSKNKYLAYLFLTEAWRSQIRKRVTGVKLFSISKKILAETTILIPNNATVIVSYLDDKCAKIDKLIEIKQSKIEKLQEYKKSLVYEYVTGKREVL